MKLNALTIIRFVLALLTVLALATHSKIPLKEIVIYPRKDVLNNYYGPEGEFTINKTNELTLYCTTSSYKTSSSWTPCGFILLWDKLDIKGVLKTKTPPSCEDIYQSAVKDAENKNCQDTALPHPIDLSEFEGLKVLINYVGSADQIDIQVNNFEPELLRRGRDLQQSNKAMSALVKTEDLKAGPIFLRLDEFIVDEWWILANKVPWELAVSSFNNTISLNVDILGSGAHRLRVEKIELVGKRLKKQELLHILLFFWLVYIVVEVFTRYIQLIGSAKKSALSIKNLSNESIFLKAEKNELEVKSTTDNLSGILNRTGFLQSIESFYNESASRDHQFGLMVIDIDHFKLINDNYGHSYGDKVISSLSSLISKNIRKGDIFARWGGEEFLLVVPNSTVSDLAQKAEQLRRFVEGISFKETPELRVTISVGLSMSKQGEKFENLFKRADLALYKAKNQRNCIFIEE